MKHLRTIEGRFKPDRSISYEDRIELESGETMEIVGVCDDVEAGQLVRIKIWVEETQPTVTVTLEALAPNELPLPYGLLVGLVETTGPCGVSAVITGPRDRVLRYVGDNWGHDERCRQASQVKA